MNSQRRKKRHQRHIRRVAKWGKWRTIRPDEHTIAFEKRRIYLPWMR